MSYLVEVDYGLPEGSFFGVDYELEKELEFWVGAETDGHGSGMGRADYTWVFTSKRQAEKAKRQIIKALRNWEKLGLFEGIPGDWNVIVEKLGD